MLKLNEILGLGLGRDELVSLAMQVGSDVPFFVFGSPAVARGLGDILDRIDGIPEAWIVIVKPQGGVSTADAYKSIDLGLTVDKKNTIMPKFDGTLEGLAREMWNDFEPLVEKRLPDIAKIKEGLLGHGSLRVMLSGSGSSVFGIFRDQEKASEACSKLRSNTGWAVFLARNIFD
jgi:4-diphosphocytidyl-2-C-methyl-D-erythritol kinase